MVAPSLVEEVGERSERGVFVIYSAKLMYVICGSPLEVKAKG